MFEDSFKLVNVLYFMEVVTMFTDTHWFFALGTNYPSNNMQEIRSIDQNRTLVSFYDPNLIGR